MLQYSEGGELDLGGEKNKDFHISDASATVKSGFISLGSRF
jgi:hypothetical protein